MNENKKEDLIKNYRNQLNLKNDIIKGKNEEIIKIKKEYNNEIEKLKSDNEIEKNNIIENNLKLIYQSERKLKKINDNNESYFKSWFYYI